MDAKLKVVITYNLIKNEKENKKIEKTADQDHPLFMDALNKFKGEIIK